MTGRATGKRRVIIYWRLASSKIALRGTVMGRLSTRGGVRAKGASRIQLDFNYAGIRYRPTIAAAPTESNLQRAR